MRRNVERVCPWGNRSVSPYVVGLLSEILSVSGLSVASASVTLCDEYVCFSYVSRGICVNYFTSVCNKNHTGMQGYSDTNRNLQEHRHVISGYVFCMDGGAISWNLRKQVLVLLSTTESEYVAMTHATKEALWIRMFLGEILCPLANRCCCTVTISQLLPWQRMISTTHAPST